MSSELDEHIERVEKYGFVRSNFPLSYGGHEIIILSNDAHLAKRDRLFFDFSLYCTNCGTEGNISARLPSEFGNQLNGLVKAKVAVFEPFYANECDRKI